MNQIDTELLISKWLQMYSDQLWFEVFSRGTLEGVKRASLVASVLMEYRIHPEEAEWDYMNNMGFFKEFLCQ